MYKNINSKNSKEVYIQLCVNDKLVSESDPSACGDLGRVKGRRGKLQIEFDRLETGDPESVYLLVASLEEEKPPVKKWVLNSFLRPHWGHKQINIFNKREDLAALNTAMDTTGTFLLKNIKQKKRKIVSVIGGLLVVGGLIELTSNENHQTSKQKYNDGYADQGEFFYTMAKNQRRIALVFGGAALLVDLGNVINVFSKGNKLMRDYHKNYPKGQKCSDW
ncbi:MAG: hypothetical protein ACPG49_03655 [Chitinophagales bacterium]